MAPDKLCVNCNFWTRQVTTLQQDPNAVGYSPMAGGPETKEWGQCRPGGPQRYFIPPAGQDASNLLQWPVTHEKDSCGEWEKQE